MRFLAILTVATLAIAGCATSGLSPDTAAPLAYKAFGQDAIMYWVQGGDTMISRAMTRVVPAGAPIVTNLKDVVSRGSKQSVRIAVAGTDSGFTAEVIKKALGSVHDDVPNLHLLFIGNRTHEPEVRRAVEAKRGMFTFEEEASS